MVSVLSRFCSFLVAMIFLRASAYPIFRFSLGLTLLNSGRSALYSSILAQNLDRLKLSQNAVIDLSMCSALRSVGLPLLTLPQ